MSDQADKVFEYTTEQRSQIMTRVRRLHERGEPGKAIGLKARLLAGEEILPGEYTDGVNPEKEIATDDLSNITPPPSTGPGSSTAAWAGSGMRPNPPPIQHMTLRPKPPSR